MIRAARLALLAALALAPAFASGCCGPQKGPAQAPPPEVAAIAASERARVGSLAALQGRGVVELRTKDHEGEHFDQGDLDFRWMPGRGFAASVSKLGDRWAWIGSDGVRWWAFELKAQPVALRTGQLAGTRAGTSAALPWLLAIVPLAPAPGATVRMHDGVASVPVDAGAAPLPPATVIEADFDPRSLAPVAVRIVRGGEVVCASTLRDFMPVETAGASPGAWPRIPRRVRASASGQAGTSEIAVTFDTARADREAVDKPGLYDFQALRDRFAPGKTEDDPQ
ncbi:MAG: hypothetical protein U0625_11405 [Phycisphaerales bacterium]